MVSAQSTVQESPAPETPVLLSVETEHVYRGPSTLSRLPVIALTLRLAPMDDSRWASLELPEDTLAIAPSLRTFSPSALPRWVLDLTLALQRLATGDDQQGMVVECRSADVVRVIFRYDDEHVALACARLAVRIAQCPWGDGSSFDLRVALDDLNRLAHSSALTPATRVLVDEATVRGIPHIKLDDRSLIQLGQGVHQRRIRDSVTSLTPALGVQTAADKQLTAELLRAVGLPTPDGTGVRTAADAAAAADGLGLPVVLKPADGARGEGATVGVNSDEEVRVAFARAERSSRRGVVLVEQQLAGRDYRLLVVGGRVVAIAERINAQVGDGTAVSTIDRTLAHPDNISAAQEAAGAVGLDVAGVDIIVPDIARSVREAGGIVDVDPAPDLGMHTHPSVGDPQYVSSAIMDLLFPPGARSRIPVIAITGTNGKTTTARMMGHILKATGRHVGMTSTDGIFIDQRRMASYDAAGPQSARIILQNPSVDFAVFEVARGGILREGLGYEHNDVAVVLNVTADHLGLGGVDTLEQLAAVKRVIVEAVPPDGTAVLNADDSLVVEMEPFCSGSTMYFTMSDRSDVVDAHCARGGRAAVLESTDAGENLVFRHGNRRMHVVRVDQIRATFGGRARMNVQNAMAAASAAFAVGTSLDHIRHGLRTFDTSYSEAPGRLNVTELRGATVVIDYAHNAAAIHRLGEFVDRFAASQTTATRRIGVIAMPGDRRDADLRENGAAAAWYFDTLVIHENRARGKEPGETARIVEQGVREAMAASARCSTVEIVLDLVEACDRALSMLQPADIGVLCVDRADVAWTLVQQRRDAALE